jgi:hypothetical protein
LSTIEFQLVTIAIVVFYREHPRQTRPGSVWGLDSFPVRYSWGPVCFYKWYLWILTMRLVDFEQGRIYQADLCLFEFSQLVFVDLANMIWGFPWSGWQHSNFVS